MKTVRDRDALQYMWYVENTEPPEPVWELDMAVSVETARHGDKNYTTTTFYSKSKPETEWIKAGKPINLTAIR